MRRIGDASTLAAFEEQVEDDDTLFFEELRNFLKSFNSVMLVGYDALFWNAASAGKANV